MQEKLIPIKVNDEIVCYAKGEKNAKFVSESIYQMRGYFSENFEEVIVSLESPIKADIK